MLEPSVLVDEALDEGSEVTVVESDPEFVFVLLGLVLPTVVVSEP